MDEERLDLLERRLWLFWDLLEELERKHFKKPFWESCRFFFVALSSARSPMAWHPATVPLLILLTTMEENKSSEQRLDRLEENLRLAVDRLDSLEQFMVAKPSRTDPSGFNQFLEKLEALRAPIGYGLAVVGLGFILATMSQKSRDEAGLQIFSKENAAIVLSVGLSLQLGAKKKPPEG